MSAVELDLPLLRRDFPLPGHAGAAGKEDRGRVLVVGGSRTIPGGALLAGVSALRAGAGKLRIATAGSVAVPMAMAIPEALVAGYPETAAGGFAASALEEVAGRLRGTTAAVVGPGMMGGEETRRLLELMLAGGEPVALVLDAACLRAVADMAERARGWAGGLVLLPHADEMCALLDCSTEEVEADPARAAARAAERYGAAALCKGSTSQIAAPGGRAFFYRGGVPGLGTSGSGDTLAGIVGAMLARGLDPLGALLWSVWLHGEAGRLLAHERGRLGFLAREIPDKLPGLMDEV